MSDLQLAHPTGLTNPTLHLIRIGAASTLCGLLAKDWRRLEFVVDRELCRWCTAELRAA